MTFANVLIYVALIVLVLARRFRGHPIGNMKKLFALPVVVTIIGFLDLSHGKLKPLALTLIVVGPSCRWAWDRCAAGPTRSPSETVPRTCSGASCR
jgi:hypothetical protein